MPVVQITCVIPVFQTATCGAADMHTCVSDRAGSDGLCICASDRATCGSSDLNTRVSDKATCGTADLYTCVSDRANCGSADPYACVSDRANCGSADPYACVSDSWFCWPVTISVFQTELPAVLLTCIPVFQSYLRFC